MFLRAHNGTLALKNGEMDYIRFGRGAKTLIMLPGLGDSLRSIKGAALPMALLYRRFAREYTVYSFSRKHPLCEGCTTRGLADDQIEAMDILGISKADLIGVSMGGMISQQLAVNYPERIGKLVLAVTCAEQNPLLVESVNEWMDCARRGDHKALMESNLRRIYSAAYYRRNKWLLPVVGRLMKPRTYERFFIQAQACLTHDTMRQLSKVRSETLVIGGEKDNALGGEASRKMAAVIPGAELKMYPDGGHGLYDEEKDFQKCILDFLLKQNYNRPTE